MGRLQTVFVILNLLLILATIIALPVGTHMNSTFNHGAYIFANVTNLTTWPAGWAFMLSWLSPIWTIGAFDSCVHISEEASNAAKAVPYGILMSIGTAGLLGFIINIVIAACIDQNLDNVLGSAFSQPMAQIYYDAVGKQGTLGMF
jgi:amino acid transporter